MPNARLLRDNCARSAGMRSANASASSRRPSRKRTLPILTLKRNRPDGRLASAMASCYRARNNFSSAGRASVKLNTSARSPTWKPEIAVGQVALLATNDRADDAVFREFHSPERRFENARAVRHLELDDFGLTTRDEVETQDLAPMNHAKDGARGNETGRKTDIDASGAEDVQELRTLVEGSPRCARRPRGRGRS